MDVHPTQNVSIGIDPYPYLLDLEVSAVDRWKASPCDVLRHTCLNWWEAEPQRTWEKNHQLSVGAGSPIRRDVCLLLLLQPYKNLGEIPRIILHIPVPLPQIIHMIQSSGHHWGWQQGNLWGQYSDSSSSSAGSWAPPFKSQEIEKADADTNFDEHLDASDPRTDEMNNMKLTWPELTNTFWVLPGPKAPRPRPVVELRNHLDKAWLKCCHGGKRKANSWKTTGQWLAFAFRLSRCEIMYYKYVYIYIHIHNTCVYNIYIYIISYN